MSFIDFTQIALRKLVTHHIGNKIDEEGVSLSNETTDIEDSTLEYLLTYFLQPFKQDEVFKFMHSVELGMNEMKVLADRIFAENSSFITDSQGVAKLLYEYSAHPKIKSGELNVAYFSDVDLEGEKVDAIGIFKSENHVPFLRIKSAKSNYSINHELGFEIKGIDKGCLILNTEKDDGYRMLLVDNINRGADAAFWRNDFLKVQPIENEYHQTTQFLTLTKNYITKQISEDFVEVNKADKIDLLNRSVEFFNTHESFKKEEFEQEVFKDENIIQAFREYDVDYRQTHEVNINDEFEISQQAVKKQARVFKSVLKLDKNFHIYIHGDKELIERGVDVDGRKYYKIYYDQES